MPAICTRRTLFVNVGDASARQATRVCAGKTHNSRARGSLETSHSCSADTMDRKQWWQWGLLETPQAKTGLSVKITVPF